MAISYRGEGGVGGARGGSSYSGATEKAKMLQKSLKMPVTTGKVKAARKLGEFTKKGGGPAGTQSVGMGVKKVGGNVKVAVTTTTATPSKALTAKGRVRDINKGRTTFAQVSGTSFPKTRTEKATSRRIAAAATKKK